MKVPFSWLLEYMSCPISPQELADRLTMAGHEVGECAVPGALLAGIRTVKIKSIVPHPDADRLVVTTVYDGTENYQVVTGASNVFEGAVVPFSPPGAVLANGTRIKKAKLRGVPSHGMLCSEAELGVADEADGIWILPADTPLGVDFVSYAYLNDCVLDIDVLPNRGDCQSILGIAREVGVLLDEPVIWPNTSPHIDAADLNYTVDVSEGCRKYTASVIKGIRSIETPFWMVRRLQLVGIKPISFVVDVTNYVLMEMGQPLHAFDAAKIEGFHIEVKEAPTDAVWTGLDDKSLNVSQNDLVVASGNHLLALAGVMGGKDSACDEATHTIILEAAEFDPVSVRRMAQRHGLRTESSIRFEKGIDPLGIERASGRAAVLLQEQLDVSVALNVVAFEHLSYVPKTLNYFPDRINQLLGSDFSTQQMRDTLKALGFDFSQDGSVVSIPSWRERDVTTSACLAEEIGRILGFDSIPAVEPSVSVVLDNPTPMDRLESRFRQYFIGHGFSETVTFPMISHEEAEFVIPDSSRYLEIQNPLNKKEAIMRPSLLPSVLKAVAQNTRNGQSLIKLFEWARTYDTTGETDAGIAVFSLDRMAHPFFNYDKSRSTLDFFDIKGLAHHFFECLGIEFKIASQSPDFMFPNQSVALEFEGHQVGYYGLLNPLVGSQMGVQQRLGVIAVNGTALTPAFTDTFPVFRTYSKMPSTRRDVALVVPKSLPYAHIYDAFWSKKPTVLESIVLFDYFESEQLPTDHVGMALGFTYRDAVRTLTDKDVDPIHEPYVRSMLDELPIQFR